MCIRDSTYNGAISAQVLNAAGDFRTTIGQLNMHIKKTTGDAGVRGKLQTGGIQHQWVLNTTYYTDPEHDYGRRSVPGADWTTNCLLYTSVPSLCCTVTAA